MIFHIFDLLYFEAVDFCLQFFDCFLLLVSMLSELFKVHIDVVDKLSEARVCFLVDFHFIFCRFIFTQY